LVGTYPPTRCGIATFTASLAKALQAVRPTCLLGVVACVDGRAPALRSSEVVAQLVSGSPASRRAATAALNGFDVVVLQHEFGIYGGEDGYEAVELVRDLRVPVIAVLHTVLSRPTARQRRVMAEIVSLADRVVVQSEGARARLLQHYAVDAAKVHTIPHGARPNLPAQARRRDRSAPVVLTWGLLGRDKGIEWGIDAIALLADLEPPPRYVILGQTHPKVLETMGEEYRDSLRRRAAALGVADRVEFDDTYHDTRALLQRVQEADVVLLPYRSREQVVSGVLVEAIASGKPVVATRFPHAEELLAEGSGLLVPHGDAGAIAVALRSLIGDPELAASTAAVARQQARSLFWESVGARYLALAEALLAAARQRGRRFPPPPYAHLLRLSNGVGVFEHAQLALPRIDHGYCTDDVARALVAVMREPERPPRLEQLAESSLSFLERAQLPDGRFHSRASIGGDWLDEVGPDDATGRALWAAGTTAARATWRSQRVRALALFEASAGFRTTWARANAFAVLGAAEVADATLAPSGTRAYELLEAAVSGLGALSDDPVVPWPEPRLTYANAVLAEARLAAGVALDDEELVTEGLELLRWLVDVETRGDSFSFTPAGGWAPGEPRPGFDQQPIEAAAMADACARAFDVTGKPEWMERALGAAAWFLGANDLGLPLLDVATGGCRDGLERDGVNENEGAESTIALITALQQARRLQAAASSASTSAAVSTVAAPTQLSAAP
jgi:glycosyltransferase involved in cell wall biosynthesis